MPLPGTAESHLRFKNVKALHDDRFTFYGNYTSIYLYTYYVYMYVTADFETTCTPVPSLCRLHHEQYSRSTSNEQNRKIVEDCKSAGHVPDSTLKCSSCYMTKVRKRTKILRECKNKDCLKIQEKYCKKCTAALKSLDKIMDHLVRCKTEKCKRCLMYQKHDEHFRQCDHSNTERVSRLDPVHFTIICYDNALNRIHSEHSYTGYDCIANLLAWLHDIEPKLLEVIDNVVEIDRSTITKEHLDKIDSYNLNNEKIECYACGRSYEKKQKYIHLDHCHGSGKFRGKTDNNNNNADDSVHDY